MEEIINPQKNASDILEEIHSVSIKNAPNLRKIRKEYSRKLKNVPANKMLDLAKELVRNSSFRWVAFELLLYHPVAFRLIGETEVREFGTEINSWGAVDVFAGLLAGPAWQKGQISDELVLSWAHSDDRWWRRTALVCTVALNRKTIGGNGDVPRTLQICRLLAADKDDMVIKAMSWALRELIPHDTHAVREFLIKYDDVLASRVKREVNNKLTTGLKNPKIKKK